MTTDTIESPVAWAPSPKAPRIAPAVLPDGLQNRLSAGDVILIAGRASQSYGPTGRVLAVRNGATAAKVLDAKAGFKVSDQLPSEDELVLLFEARADHRRATGLNGRQLVHRVLELELNTTPRVVLLIQQGSGKAMSAEGHQASADIVAEAVDRLRPALLAVAEVRGIVRDHAAIGQPLLRMRHNTGARGEPPFYSDRREGLTKWSSDLEMRLIGRAKEANEEAVNTGERTTEAIRRLTGGPVLDGQVSYYCGAPLPPPLAAVTLDDSTGYGKGRRIAFIDTPGCRPDEHLRGMPSIRREKAGVLELVDQVEVLRECYRVAYTAGFDAVATVNHIVALGYSSEAVRRSQRRTDAQPVARDPAGRSTAAKILGRIFDHIDFPCTGVFTLPVPGGGGDTVVLLPPDGRPICTAADRARIEAARPRMKSLRQRRRVSLLAGHLATVDGFPAVLCMAKDRKSGELIYRFVRGPKRDGKEIPKARIDPRKRLRTDRNTPIPPIRYQAFLLALMAAFAENELMPALPLASARANRAAAAIRAAETALERAIAAEERGASMLKKNPSGPAWVLAHDTYNEAVVTRHTAKAEVDRLRAELHQSDEPRGLPLDELLDFFAALRDPFDQTYRELVGLDLAQLRVTTVRSRVQGGLIVSAIKVRTQLRVFTPDGREWVLDVAFRQEWRRRDVARSTRAKIDALRQGRPLRPINGNRYPRSSVRVALGHRTEFCCTVLIQDPRLVRLSMAVNHPIRDNGRAEPLTDLELRRLARDLSEPYSLLQRLRDLHAAPRRPGDLWKLEPAPALRRLLVMASDHAIEVRDIERYLRVSDRWRPHLEQTKDGLRTRKCRFCRSRNRVRPLIAEMEGLLCLDCRRDDLGHAWPAHPYDLYVDR
jgi:hypothetical protein